MFTSSLRPAPARPAHPTDTAIQVCRTVGDLIAVLDSYPDEMPLRVVLEPGVSILDPSVSIRYRPAGIPLAGFGRQDSYVRERLEIGASAERICRGDCPDCTCGHAAEERP